MTVLRSARVLIAVALCMITFGGVMVTAQESSPAAEACISTTVEENIDIVNQLYAAIEGGDAEAMDAFLADHFTHNTDRFGLPDDPYSNDDEIHLMMMMSVVYPESSEVVHHVFGADDKVVMETSRTITHHAFTGELVELEAPVELRTIAIFTFECGEIVSMSAIVNTFELLVGLGVFDPQEAESTPES